MNTDETNDFISQRLEIECLVEEVAILEAEIQRLNKRVKELSTSP